MFKRWPVYLGAVVALLLVSGLALVVSMTGANFIQSFSINVLKEAEWTDLHSVQATYTARTILNFYYVIIGILFLGFFIFMEHKLITTGIPQKLVLRRTLFTLGIEFLILFFFHVATMTFISASPFQIGLGTVEVLLGIGFIYLGRRKAPILPWLKESK